MSDTTKIEWCDSTFNPWVGCTKVGPGCDHCYAETSTPSRTLGVVWGPKAERHRTSPANWKMPLRWNAQSFVECASCGWRGEVRAFKQTDPQGADHTMCPNCAGVDYLPARRRVFCASLADVFDNQVPDEWRADLFRLIEATPHLDWLLVTKRIGNVPQMVMKANTDRFLANEGFSHGLPGNVWLGITVVNQDEAHRDLNKLMAIAVAVRWVSVEPLLAALDLSPWLTAAPVQPNGSPGLTNKLDWVVVGGESGAQARPMHPDWARDLRDQCEQAGVPFLFKQWGEWTPGENVTATTGTVPTANWFNEQWDFHSENLACEPYHCDYEPDLYRVGKKAAGRSLDGIEHNGFPEVRP